MNKPVQFITRTAVLLALTVLFQSLRSLFPMIPANISQYLVGSLVNLCLIVASVMVGYQGGLIIAVVAPIIALLQGFTPFPVLVPAIASGNAVLVVTVSLLHKRNAAFAAALGAVLKFITLTVGVVYIVVPFLLENAPDKAKAALSLQFSWPQLITALIGGAVAMGVLAVLRNVIKEN